MRAFLRQLPSVALLGTALFGAALPACSGQSMDGDLPLDGTSARDSNAERAATERSETVAYIDVERVALAAPDNAAQASGSQVNATVNAAVAPGVTLPPGAVAPSQPGTVSQGSVSQGSVSQGSVSQSSVPQEASVEANAAGSTPATAQALAHFAETTTRATRLLELAGLIRHIPEIGQCEPGAADRAAPDKDAATVPDTGAFELLEAGAVRLIPEGQAAVTLAPRAFPGVSSLASGVVYTSRERSAMLPSDVPYQIEVSGSGEISPMTIRGQAPRQLDNVTLDGSPLPIVEQVNIAHPHDVTWDVGVSGDVVYIDIQDEDEVQSVRCAYADEAGTGSIPAASLARLSGNGRLTVHRLRRITALPAALGTPSSSGSVLPSRAEVRFDFELGRSVQFLEQASAWRGRLAGAEPSPVPATVE